ncbi:methyl-accepting chemotaxis protein [Thiomicrorhabdus indica]|uniref:methyl-accepting chemotaxis protein n=1 Tax=Thiomicrorhabdus indica TaxID=2267253 RepID=UPI002AA6DF69|nr:methyl-accepting chemotaxis protein [Thiomicrorhabdus indica]
MFKTIKSKLITSFSVMTLLIIALSAVSITKTQESSEGFKDYREMARDTTLSGLIQSNMLMVRMNVKDYLMEPVEKEVQEFNQYFEQTDKFVTEALEEIKKQGRDVLVMELNSDLRKYHQEFESVQTLMDERNHLVNNIIHVNGSKIRKQLNEVMLQAEQRGDLAISLQTAKAIQSFMLARLYSNKFIASNTEASMQLALKEYLILSQQLKTLNAQIQDTLSSQLLNEAMELIQATNNAVKQLNQVIKTRNEHVQLLNTIGPKMAQTAEDIKLSIKKDQDTIGPMVQSLNEQIISMMIIVSLVIAVIAIAIGYLIPRLISKGLGNIQSDLNKISQTGDFSIRSDQSREDEIGEMAAAVNSMVNNMQLAIQEANTVVSAISKGKFDQRVTLDVAGDLKTLKDGINNSADSISTTMKALGDMMQAMSNGEFSHQINAQVEGDFDRMMQNASSTMHDLNGTINGIIGVMDQMQNGHFEHRCIVEAKGDLLRLKDGVNHSMIALDAAMKDIISIVVAQSDGDLTKTITNEYHGELNTLKQSINSTSSKLIDVVSKALNATSVVNSASDEVSKGALDLSQRVQEQAAALEETSATMNEMNSQVQSNTDNAQQATKVAEEVSAKTDQGAQVMQETIDAMNAIQDSSHRVAEIVTLIDGIAFQTNLLALNAAVEAARAGEHGRGFAVVAGEVRSLAQKSAEAAKDIKNLIDETVNRVNHGSSLASQSGEMLSEINASITSVTSMIAQIAEASSEQAEGVSQVHQAITQIDEVTQQNAALVEQTSAAAESMSEQAELLNQDMAFFNTGQAHLKSQATQAAKSKSTRSVEEKTSKSNSQMALPKPTATSLKSSTSDDSEQWGEF